MGTQRTRATAVIDLAGLDALIGILRTDGYRVRGPRKRGSAVVHDELTSVRDLPDGWHDEQAPGEYRLVSDSSGRRFGVALAADSPKGALHPSRARVWTMQRTADGEVAVHLEHHDPSPLAFLGLRACEVAAIGRQDTVLAQGPHPDPAYVARRSDNVVVAMACTRSVETCFCASMGTGPEVGDGADLVLTELASEGAEPVYLVEIGSEIGAALLQRLERRAATAGERREAATGVAEAAASQVRRIDPVGAHDGLFANLESARWDEIAERCLTCGNCTLVCPTCFCTDLVDITDLGGEIAERWRAWDSCFSLEFSHLGPGPVRRTGGQRYRQWLTHKLAGWVDQFGETGCVGCGRCITWCPVGIDLTAEVAEVTS